FRSHRIYISREQRLMFFTYNGGPVFDVNPAREDGRRSADAPPELPTPAPSDAVGFARRGQLLFARSDYPGAIADLDHAIELAPGNAASHLTRARVRMAMGAESAAVLADLDAAVRLTPDDPIVRLTRGLQRQKTGDAAGAHEDFDGAIRLDPSLRLRVA